MEECPIKYALRLLGGKWKLQIVWELQQQEVIRFNALQRRLSGISSVMLSKTLEELENTKLVHREQYNEIPPRVEYSLTPLGKSLEPALKALGDWGLRVYQETENAAQK